MLPRQGEKLRTKSRLRLGSYSRFGLLLSLFKGTSAAVVPGEYSAGFLLPFRKNLLHLRILTRSTRPSEQWRGKPCES